MRAGPYIESKYKMEKSMAAYYLQRAMDLEKEANECRRKAYECLTRAEWWANDTDILAGR
jgi:hypothetical protein